MSDQERESRTPPPRSDPEEVSDRRRQRVLTVSAAILAGLGIVLALRASAQLLIPVVLAVLLNLLLMPFVRRLRRIGVPAPVGAVAVMLALTGGVGYAMFELSGPAQEWMRELPGSMRELRYELRGIARSLEEVQEAANEVENLAGGGEGDRTVRLQGGGGLLVGARSLLASGLVCWFLLLFLLATPDGNIRSLVRVLPTLDQKKAAVEVLRSVEQEVSRYLVTITGMNVLLGAAVGFAMYVLDLPNPALWGVMAAILNFVPYVGSLVGVCIVGFVAVGLDGSSSQALLAPLSYAVLSSLEGMLITPTVLGHRLRLRPVIVFLGLLFWGYLWGIAGALLAVPMLVAFNILCLQMESLRPVGRFLSNDDGLDPDHVASSHRGSTSPEHA